ncbi:15564_t:CDS:2, partial [Racocetra fulgida]
RMGHEQYNMVEHYNQGCLARDMKVPKNRKENVNEGNKLRINGISDL